MADTVQITMPQMGESVSEGTVLTWHKQEGDWVDKDETVVEVSTDKVDAEIPAPAAGKLVKILAQEDEMVEVGAGARARSSRARRRPATAPLRKQEPHHASRPRRTTEASLRRRRGHAAPRRRHRPRPPTTPRSRRSRAASPPHTASTSNRSSGSGTGGRVVKDDVLSHVERNGGDGATAATRRRPTARPQPRRPPEPQPLRGGDAMLARYMTESLSIPTATSFRTLRGRHARRAPAPAQRGAEGGAARHEGLVHAPDRLRDHPRARDHPAMGHSFRRAGRQASPRRATST